ncbi:MAG: hypothetical protein QOG68_1878, partial [Solirubrobacteraceae bacterium]|nr:hypothetical protein [Solirubrobacteraceae bacterium]
MNDPTTSAEQDRLARLLRRGVWRTEVEVRRSELTHRLEVARVPPAAPPPRHTGETVELHGETVNVVVTVDEVVPAAGMPDAERRTHVETIESALGTARDAAGSPHSVLAWWSGSAVTLAWESVHAAEGELIEIESEAAVRSNLPHLVAWMAEVMEKSPQRDGY